MTTATRPALADLVAALPATRQPTALAALCRWEVQRHALGIDDEAMLLDVLGLMAPAPVPACVPVVLPLGVRHGSRSAYNRYRCRCGRCRASNRLYAARWRRGRLCPRPDVTSPPRIAPAVLDHPCGRGAHRAFPGQLLIPIGEAA